MSDIVKCPVCGESNLPDQEFCAYCRSRLQPLTGSTKGADAPIKPGQFPTKKNTAELEPILPQWLRDARDSARKSAEEDANQAAKQQPQSLPASSRPDLLAGLHSQADNDEEETPDWLASITGSTPKSKKNQAEPSEVRWVELGDANDFAKDESEGESDTPSWMAGITASKPQPNEKDELLDWLQSAGNSNIPSKPTDPAPVDTSFSTAANDGTSDWLKQMAADNMQDDSSFSNHPSETFKAAPSDTPDWLRQMSAQEGEQFNKPSSTESQAGFDSISSETPDWLRGIGETQPDQTQSADPFGASGSNFIESGAAQTSFTEDVPDWLTGLPPVDNKPSTQDAVPTWLKEEKSTPAEDAEVPSWLSGTPTPAVPAARDQDLFSADDSATLGDLPGWLHGATSQDSLFNPPSSELPSFTASSDDDAPDWLNTFKSVDAAQSAPAFSMDAPIDSAPPAFTSDSLSGNKTDALFTDMPDWLSSATEASASSNPPPLSNSDAIIPGELPSWVQAMRPVNSSASRPVSSSPSTDQTLESRGALAGLPGVLPSVPGFAPTSKPKAYSIKLQASEEQQSHAALLEQILAAETEPVPIASFSTLRTSRTLRWALSIILLAVLTIVVSNHTQIFSLPLGTPNEINNAWQVAQSIPEGAPVLVAFDYEPARVGEMEAAAAPLFNLMRKPSLTFISTSETGALLAERFTSGALAGFYNDSGISYLNLGYLPGGPMGIRAFVQNPASTMSQLAGITSFSQFSAFILITDNADDARMWIEQTASTRGTTPILVVSSAQSSPMIQPYFESQQVSGLISGLYGGAVLENNNSGGPAIARSYWDAFSIGMLLAMIFILGGGLLNLALGLRDRAAARGEK